VQSHLKRGVDRSHHHIGDFLVPQRLAVADPEFQVSIIFAFANQCPIARMKCHYIPSLTFIEPLRMLASFCLFICCTRLLHSTGTANFTRCG